MRTYAAALCMEHYYYLVTADNNESFIVTNLFQRRFAHMSKVEKHEFCSEANYVMDKSIYQLLLLPCAGCSTYRLHSSVYRILSLFCSKCDRL